MIRTRYPTLALACLAGALALGASAPACAAGSIKAAYVEQVIPSRPWSGHTQFTNAPSAIGPGFSGNLLGVTSITLTNFDSTEQQVFIFSALLGTASPAGCASNIVGGGDPAMQVYLKPHETLHLTYPTPLVFSPGLAVGGLCIAAEVTTTLHGGAVEMDVNGVIN